MQSLHHGAVVVAPGEPVRATASRQRRHPCGPWSSADGRSAAATGWNSGCSHPARPGNFNIPVCDGDARNDPTLPHMKKWIVEFIGTFFLVLTVGLAVRQNAPLAPLAIGSILMVMIFAGGHISGGHFNPAVTLAAFLRGRCDRRDVLPYWIAQFVGGAAAALLVNAVLRGRVDVAAVALHPTVASFIVEFLFTFALAWVVLNVATSKGTMGNSFYGLAIGFTVLVGAITVGGISGGAFNPAVGLGVFTMGLESGRQFAVYLVSEFAGAAVAAYAYRAINGLD